MGLTGAEWDIFPNFICQVLEAFGRGSYPDHRSIPSRKATALQKRQKSATETVDVQWQHSFPLPLLLQSPPPPPPTKSKKQRIQQEEEEERGFNTEDEVSIT